MGELRYYKILVFRLIFAILIAGNMGFLALIITPLSMWISYVPLFLFFGAGIKGNILNVGSTRIEYIDVCAAVGAYILLALLLSLTKDLKFEKGLRVFFVGSLLILIANVIRIDMMILLLKYYGSDLFDTLHLFVWKFVSTFYVVIVWVFLVNKFKIKEIPIYSDIKFLYEKSLFFKKSRKN
tara:strand:- start:1908 stop:2453 length:546 start_codon:yes stop_codon:yes gene_type:complete